MDGKFFPVLALMAAAFIWSIAGASYKFFLSIGFTFALIFWFSRVFKTLSVSLIAFSRKVKIMPLNEFKNKKELLLNALFSIGTPVFFVLALEQTSLSNVYFLNYTMPAWVFIFAAIILGEKITGKKTVALGLMLAGIYFIASPQNLSSLNPGILFGLASALTFTGDIITSRELKDYSFHAVAVYSNFFQLLIFTALSVFLFLPQFDVDYSANLVPLALLAGAGMVLGLASDLYYFALEHIEASMAGVVALSELVFATVISTLFFSEIPSMRELTGYALIILAVLIFVLRKADLWHFGHLLRFHRSH